MPPFKLKITSRDRIETDWANRVRAAASSRPRRRIHDAWVEAPINKNWTVAYRLAVGTFGEPIVAELRIFPREATEGRPAGQWSAEVLGIYAKAPRRGIKAALVRSVTVGGHHEVGGQFAEWLADVAPELRSITFTGTILRSTTLVRATTPELRGTFKGVVPKAAKRKRGRPTVHDDQFFAELVRDYAYLVAKGSAHPTKDLAETRGVSRSRMRALLNEARKRRFLSGTGRGRSGGRLTERATAILLCR